jgi:hypothetical protein
MMSVIDQELVNAFASLHQPADRIACFRPLRDQFLGLLSEQVRGSRNEDDICWRLLQLRKSGKLPAFHREAH